jgi:hypothetical protein
VVSWPMDRDGNKRRLTPDDIPVVAPYNLQVKVLQRTLPPNARVGNADKFPGQEATVSIVSMTTSSEEDLSRHLALLFSKKAIPPGSTHMTRHWTDRADRSRSPAEHRTHRVRFPWCPMSAQTRSTVIVDVASSDGRFQPSRGLLAIHHRASTTVAKSAVQYGETPSVS